MAIWRWPAAASTASRSLRSRRAAARSGWLNRDPCFDRIVVGAKASIRRVEKSGLSEGPYVRVYVAVVALQRLRQRANASYIVAPHIAQQLHPFAGQDTHQRVPILK